MAKTRKQKAELIELYKDLLENSDFVLVRLSTKIPANSMNQIRLQVRALGGRVHILKNKVFQKVARGYDGFESIELTDIIGLVTADEDLVSVIKEFEKLEGLVKQELVLRQEDEDFIKQYKAFDYVLGYLDGRVLSAEDAARLSKLSSKEELYGQLVGTMAGVLRGIMNVMNGNTLKLLYVLRNLEEKKQQEA